MANGSIAAMESISIDTVPVPDKTIHVTVPAKVAFDLAQMQKVTKDVLARFNCPECHSGLDIRFDIARRIRVDESLNLFDAQSGDKFIGF